MLQSPVRPLVSILIPTYNRAHYLSQALQSAVEQSYGDLEILVLDDCGTDDTASVIGDFKNDERVRYVRHERNLGISENWKWGIDAMRGEFFCLLHDDDTFERDFVEKLLVPLLEDSSLILSFCDHWVIDEKSDRLPELGERMTAGTKRGDLPPGRLSDFKSAATLDVSIPVGASLFRRSIVDATFIEERAQGAIDAWLLYRCAKSGHGAFFVKERLMNYRAHEGGMSKKSISNMMGGHIFRYGEIYNDEDFSEIHPQIHDKLARALSDQGRCFLDEGNDSEARVLLINSLKIRLTLRSFILLGLTCLSGLGVRIARKFLRRI